MKPLKIHVVDSQGRPYDFNNPSNWSVLVDQDDDDSAAWESLRFMESMAAEHPERVTGLPSLRRALERRQK